MTAICLFLLGSSLFVYQWQQLKSDRISHGQELIENSTAALSKLKRKVNKFDLIAHKLINDDQLKSEYFDKKVKHQSEFYREGIENISYVLDSTYGDDVFFELKHFSIKHSPAANNTDAPEVTMIVEGEKRLEKR